MKDQTKDNAPKPMDEAAPERAAGVMATNTQRVCHAVRTLVAEVHEVFPETPVEFSMFNGRNTALAVAFDLTALDKIEADDLALVLRLLDTDIRVESVIAEDGQALVTMKNSLRTQDNTEPFNIIDGLEVLDEPVDFMGGSSL